MTRKDPIIEEIHVVREALAREADYDLERMLEAARARQAASGSQPVTLPPAQRAGRAQPRADAEGRIPG
jgi:hypothetical protein